MSPARASPAAKSAVNWAMVACASDTCDLSDRIVSWSRASRAACPASCGAGAGAAAAASAARSSASYRLCNRASSSSLTAMRDSNRRDSTAFSSACWNSDRRASCSCCASVSARSRAVLSAAMADECSSAAESEKDATCDFRAAASDSCAAYRRGTRTQSNECTSKSAPNETSGAPHTARSARNVNSCSSRRRRLASLTAGESRTALGDDRMATDAASLCCLAIAAADSARATCWTAASRSDSTVTSSCVLVCTSRCSVRVSSRRSLSSCCRRCVCSACRAADADLPPAASAFTFATAASAVAEQQRAGAGGDEGLNKQTYTQNTTRHHATHLALPAVRRRHIELLKWGEREGEGERKNSNVKTASNGKARRGQSPSHLCH